MSETTDGGEASAALPAAYASWRAGTLGRITDAREAERMLEAIAPRPGLAVLDVGCGDGALAATLAAQGLDAAGVDRSPTMVAAARARAGREGVALRLAVADAGALPFAPATFDVVTAVTVLCFVPDADVAVREMARVLRPGGRLVIGELGRWNAWAARRRIRGWLGSPVWRQARFRTPAMLRDLARRAGLVDAAVRGAVFYPPVAIAARLLAPFDRRIGDSTTLGAAFLVLSAVKPASR